MNMIICKLLVGCFYLIKEALLIHLNSKLINLFLYLKAIFRHNQLFTRPIIQMLLLKMVHQKNKKYFVNAKPSKKITQIVRINAFNIKGHFWRILTYCIFYNDMIDKQKCSSNICFENEYHIFKRKRKISLMNILLSEFRI